MRSLACYWVCALATHAAGLWQPMHADYSCWLRVARDWRDGAVLYRDVYDNKSPWVYRWVRTIDSSHPAVTCYLAESAAAAAGATLMRAALWPAFGRTAWLAPLLVIVWTGAGRTFYGGQSTEAFAIWLDVAAISAWSIAVRRGARRWAFAAGALALVAVALRPPVILHLVAWLPLAWWLCAHRSRQVATGTVAAALLGFAAMTALFWVDAVASGHARELCVVLARNKDYAATTGGGWMASLFAGAKMLGLILLDNSVAVLLVCLSAVVAATSLSAFSRRQKYWIATAVLWGAAALAGTLPGGRHYAHYYHFLWAPLGLVATLWLARRHLARSALQWQRKLACGVAVGVIVVAVLHEASSAARYYRDSQTESHARREVERAVEFLAASAAPDVPVLVHVWGDWAELYWRVPRPSPSYSMPHVLPSELFGAWAEATLADPPELIVWDGTPWQPIDGPVDKDVSDRIETLLRQQYDEVGRFGALAVFRRRGQSSIPATHAR